MTYFVVFLAGMIVGGTVGAIIMAAVQINKGEHDPVTFGGIDRDSNPHWRNEKPVSTKDMHL